MFRSDKEMMNSASPSHLSAFAPGGLYGQSSMLQQRGGFPPTPGLQPPAQPQPATSQPTPVAGAVAGVGAGVPPTSGAQSPSRSLFGNIGAQRGILPNIAATQNLNINQIKRPNPNASGILSSTTGTATLGGFARQFGEVTPNFVDPSEFPTLGNRQGLPTSTAQAVRNYAVGVMTAKQQESSQEFQIQQEDFPALPNSSGLTNDNARKTPVSMMGLSGQYENSFKDTKPSGDKIPVANGQQRKGIKTLSDGTVTNIPQGMVTDQFGMVGLLTFIRAAETDPNLVALAPGIDLTTLGLNLNSPDNLYSTFQSPWADSPCRPQDIDFHVPSEYLTNIFIREKLAPFKLNRYGENLLFFLFYMNGGDVLQLAAAAELYNRDWRYHKEERVWITRAIGMEPELKTNTYERGTYYFFDAQNWRKVMKQFHLEYDKLEERPQLPMEILMNGNLPNATPGPH